MSGKWIEIDSPEISSAEVAANALRLRVQHVQQMLPLAAHAYCLDVEHVHRLRVGSRRADATLQAFRPLLGGAFKSLRKQIRRIRRAAGPARDIDVLLARLKKNQKKNDPDLEYLIARLECRRTEVQKMLLEVDTKAQQEKLSRDLERCLDFLAGRKEKPIQEFAKKALRKASRPLRRLASINQPSLDQLHVLRIAGKRLRYSIEIFHGACSPSLKNELYPLVEKLQSRLGRINDRATAQSLYQNWLANMLTDNRATYFARCIVQEHEAAQHLRKEFLRWWTAERMALLESHLSTWTQK